MTTLLTVLRKSVAAVVVSGPPSLLVVISGHHYLSNPHGTSPVSHGLHWKYADTLSEVTTNASDMLYTCHLTVRLGSKSIRQFKGNQHIHLSVAISVASVSVDNRQLLVYGQPTFVDLSKLFSPDGASGRGGFAEYAKAPSDLVWKIPQGTLSFEQAVATGSPYVPYSLRSRIFPHLSFRYYHQPQHWLPSLVRGPRTGATPTLQLPASKRDRRNLGLYLRRKFWSRPIRNPTHQAFGLQSHHRRFPS